MILLHRFINFDYNAHERYYKLDSIYYDDMHFSINKNNISVFSVDYDNYDYDNSHECITQRYKHNMLILIECGILVDKKWFYISATLKASNLVICSNSFKPLHIDISYSNNYSIGSDDKLNFTIDFSKKDYAISHKLIIDTYLYLRECFSVKQSIDT